ncbi:hypothetical protein HGRIS_006780 [Hohenbuehelia grisea]|uniref:Uncharacterized protein n=1 Tax=Hohenbuehelia grisea TaxID=104357 RepID=A0ABR3JA19_9AGAR
MARQIPSSSHERQLVKWNHQVDTVFPTAPYSRESHRPLDAAVLEPLSLFALAMTHVHAQLASYSEAWATGMQAIKCFESILNTHPESHWLIDWSEYIADAREEAVSWVSMTRSPSQHQVVVTEMRRRQSAVEIAGRSM